MKLALLSIGKYDGYAPPLGLASIATYLEGYMDFKNTSIIDATYDNVLKRIKLLKPDIIGLSAKTIEYSEAIKLAKEIKKDRGIPIIIGGAHISTLHNSMKSCFDIGVVGEAEETMLELMNHYEKEGGFSNIENIEGLVYFKDKKLKINKKRKLVTPLDKIPYPDRKYINKKYFEKRILPDNDYGRLSQIFTARGCPYKCVFCSTSKFWGGMRFHSIEHIKEEVNELISKYKIDHISVWDDMFAVNKRKLKEICDMFEKEGITKKITLSCQVRANVVNDELARLLKKTNVTLATIGFESGNERMLRYLKNKSVSVADNKRAIKAFHKYGIKVSGSVIFGSPSETIKDMKKTLNFIDFTIKEGLYKLYSFIMTPFPATEMWDIAKQRNKISDDMDWDLLSHQQIDNPLLLDDNIDKEEFKKIFMEGRKKLDYFRWKSFKENLKKHPFSVIKKTAKSPIRGIKIIMNKHITK